MALTKQVTKNTPYLQEQDNGRTTGNLRAMVGRGWLSLRNPLAVAQRDLERQEKPLETIKGIPRQIRRAFEKAVTGSGANPSGIEGNDPKPRGQGIEQCETQYLANAQQIEYLQHQLIDVIDHKFRCGRVDSIPAIPGKTYKLSCGVKLKLLYLTEAFDLYLFWGDDATLKSHSHDQEQHLKVVEGSLTVELGDNTHQIETGQEIVIKAGMSRQFTMIGQTKFLSMYRPPITKPQHV